MNDLPKDSAGRLANIDVPTCVENATVGEVLDSVKWLSATLDSIDYVYVLNAMRHLIGVVSLHELFSTKSEVTIGSIMVREVAYSHIRTDQEHVAQLALAQGIKAVPVIDDEMKFIGVISADVILRILNEEHTEDIYKSAGVQVGEENNFENLTWVQHVKSRIPWLLLGLIGGIFAAIVIESFEKTISAHLALAAFIPAVVYIADAVGNQSQMLFVRALGQQNSPSMWQYLKKEWGIGTVVGLILGGSIYVLSYVWLQDMLVSTILTLAIISTVYFSVTVAVVLPWFFKKINFDPAVASGPLATVVRDISSLCIYLLIATTLI